MSSFFEDLNDLVIETPAGQVLVFTWLILAFAGVVGLAIVYWITC